MVPISGLIIITIKTITTIFTKIITIAVIISKTINTIIIKCRAPIAGRSYYFIGRGGYC